MIYFLFAVSLIGFIVLRFLKVYYEYLAARIPQGQNKNENYKTVVSARLLLGLFFSSGYKTRKPGRIIEENKSYKTKASIFKSISHFLGLFCIVAFVFSIMQYWLDHTTQVELATATILKIEQTQHAIYKFIKHFKIASEYNILVAILLIVLAGSFPFIERFGIKKKLTKYNKIVASVLYILTISTSFTFFGGSFTKEEDGRIAKLEKHKLQIIDDNKLLLAKIQQEVKERTISEMLSDPQFEQAISKINQVQQDIKDTKEKEEYKEYVAAVPATNQLQVAFKIFEEGFAKKYNFDKHFDDFEVKFINESSAQNKAEDYDYYKANQESNYQHFRRENRGWFADEDLSEQAIKKANKAFETGRNASKIKTTKFYKKFKEPFEKIIDKAWDKTGQSWIKDLLNTMGVDFPFMDELVDPLINDPIKDFVKEKVAKVFNSSTRGNNAEIANELNNCYEEFHQRFGNGFQNSEKFNKLVNSVNTDADRVAISIAETLSEMRNKEHAAKDYLAKLSAEDRWEEIRTTFLDRVSSGNDLEEFAAEKQQIMKDELTAWMEYKQSKKIAWYLSSEKELEPIFYQYMKDKPQLKAVWGFALQQQDGEGAIYYYTVTHPDKTARGNPHYMVKYYCNSIGKEQEFSSYFNDYQLAPYINGVCPHTP